MTIFEFALKRSFGNPTNLIFLSLFPLAAIFLPQSELWPALPYGYHYFGILLLFVAIRLTAILIEDRTSGIVKRLAVAPITHFSYLSQNLLAFACILVLQCTVVVAGGVLYGQELGQPLMLLVLYVSFAFTALAMAVAWVALYRSKEIAFLVYMTIIVLLSLLGGMLFPVEMIPEPLSRVIMVLPTYWLTDGMAWVTSGGDLLDFWLANGVLWLYTIIFLTLGSVRKIH
ncbi:ABC transporter permease [Paenibacillus daejeonensis]|uniref:ABC transporter permease n=1 Tax=Paenibacillus daejeonensis TaxID=135193 RepID=UPI00037669E9|nr:ABC transporter permease [Paenibacillus daejeonensis]